jgi:hypothetical protein
MSTKHTPGPWQSFTSPSGLIQFEKDGKSIATVWGSDDLDRMPTRVEAQANARLIDATDDLLEALQQTLKDLYDMYYGKFVYVEGLSAEEAVKRVDSIDSIIKAKAAIEKATGGTP